MNQPIPPEAARGKKLAQKLLSKCDQPGYGPFAAMFAGQTILTKCAESARREGNAAAWNIWLKQTLEILYLPEASS